MKIIITILSLLSIWPLFSQEPMTYKLSVKERTSVKGEYKELELWRSRNQNLLIIKTQKKETLPLKGEDSLRVVEIMKRNAKKNQDELFSLLEKTAVYEVDTIQLQKGHPFLKTADRFFQNRKERKKQATESKGTRIVLDGTTYHITIADSEGGSYVFYSHSPTRESHPEIFELVSALHQTLATNQK
ncbi:hypothetical protein TH63_18375 [Rufibacter radiotolerans]|uniref:Uncharacterized protein n=1 Tax=Rufibacter radiotolerans TaxID=1379910 RepID=A0A0H4W9M5_9BACT|nr:hypothetical protein [Rufibacter radiotolerans]AKQ47161.1 hypothetical protein TH63_18375 [Rufibacter radiotolerans]